MTAERDRRYNASPKGRARSRRHDKARETTAARKLYKKLWARAYRKRLKRKKA